MDDRLQTILGEDPVWFQPPRNQTLAFDNPLRHTAKPKLPLVGKVGKEGKEDKVEEAATVVKYLVRFGEERSVTAKPRVLKELN
jgi:hypothetical protein